MGTRPSVASCHGQRIPGAARQHTAQRLAANASFRKSKAFTWLQQDAAAFGFHLSFPPGNKYGYEYEPRHWRDIASEPTPSR